MSLFNDFVTQIYGGNQARAARDIGVTRSHVSRLVSGDRAVTAEIADRCQQLSAGRFKREWFIFGAPQEAVSEDPDANRIVPVEGA
ncbi:helix-turn-helix transcriptional regulator [[Pseudomonas] boreopolis]|uniref:HTH cro/C1-type domain-containing protein n=1 Tax=Xanthomonas boreopolis TaxID=86183 RepID=A0A919F7M9_9XANT|nr:hypothetical protein GCM10009090_16290 [[Pseudomonas] boreopolis]